MARLRRDDRERTRLIKMSINTFVVGELWFYSLFGIQNIFWLRLRVTSYNALETKDVNTQTYLSILQEREMESWMRQKKISKVGRHTKKNYVPATYIIVDWLLHTFIFIRRKHFRKNNLKCQSQSNKFSFLSTPLNLKRIKYFLDVKSLHLSFLLHGQQWSNHKKNTVLKYGI